MFFAFNDENRVMISSEEPVAPNMVELVPPDGFDLDFQSDWKFVNGVWQYDPMPKEEQLPTDSDRIADLEAQLAAAKILLGVE